MFSRQWLNIISPLKWIRNSKFYIAFLDQAFVSSGNFLTLALGAHFLSINEQGKFCYLISLYMIATLFNVSVIFSVAPVIKKSINKFLYVFYRQHLFRLQFILASFISVTLCFFLYMVHTAINWDLGKLEILAVFLYIFLQQLVDFFRRSSYVFEGYIYALLASILMNSFRVLIIIVLQPKSILTMLLILITSCLLGFLPAIYIYKNKLFKIYKKRLDKGLLNIHFRLAKWNIFAAPLGWASFFLPGFVLGIIESPTSVAIYFSIKSLSSFANVGLELLETLIPKWLTSFDNNMNLRNATIKMLIFGLFIWGVAMVFILLLGDVLIGFILGEKYSAYPNVLIFFWVGNGIHYLARVVGLYFRTKKESHLEFIGSIGGIIGLLIGIPMILSEGMSGALWSAIFVPVGILSAQILAAGYKTYFIDEAFKTRGNT